MPEHYAMDANVISGTVHLENTKTAAVQYTDVDGNPVSFNFQPRVQITLLGANNNSAYKTKDIKSGNLFTGFVVGFLTPVTIDVEWCALKRIG